MSEYHTDFERHPGHFEQFLHSSPCSRAYLTHKENFFGQASQGHMGMSGQYVRGGCNSHQWINQERLRYQTIDCWWTTGYDKVNFSGQQRGANISTVGNMQVDGKGRMLAVKVPQETWHNIGPHGGVGSYTQGNAFGSSDAAQLCHCAPCFVCCRYHLLRMSIQFTPFIRQSQAFTPLLEKGQLCDAFQLCYQGGYRRL